MRSAVRFAPLAFALAALAGVAGVAGCTPGIGASCALSTDCATDGTRVCDTSEPGGFCTVLNCTGNSLGSDCPDNAFCVLFNSNVPGCPFSAQSPARTGQSQCRKSCNTDSDCRASYYCRSPSAAPWNAEILDPNPELKACLPMLSAVDGGASVEYLDGAFRVFSYGFDGGIDAAPAVCQAAGPTFDAGFAPLDAPLEGSVNTHDGAADASRDGNADSAVDARSPADGAPKDGGVLDAALDAGADGPRDGAVDGLVDAPDAG